MMHSYGFTDGVSLRPCNLIIDPDRGHHIDACIGVRHPDCESWAGVSIELDCFYCDDCRWNGRVSGAWVYDLWLGLIDVRPSSVDSGGTPPRPDGE